MANVITLLSMQVGPKITRRTYSIALSGSYVQAVVATPVGETIDLTAVVNTGLIDGGTSYQNLPKSYGVLQVPGGYTAIIVPATAAALNNFLLQIWQGTNELAAGAYPSALAALTAIGSLIVVFDFETLG